MIQARLSSTQLNALSSMSSKQTARTRVYPREIMEERKSYTTETEMMVQKLLKESFTNINKPQ